MDFDMIDDYKKENIKPQFFCLILTFKNMNDFD